MHQGGCNLGPFRPPLSSWIFANGSARPALSARTRALSGTSSRASLATGRRTTLSVRQFEVLSHLLETDRRVALDCTADRCLLQSHCAGGRGNNTCGAHRFGPLWYCLLRCVVTLLAFGFSHCLYPSCNGGCSQRAMRHRLPRESRRPVRAVRHRFALFNVQLFCRCMLTRARALSIVFLFALALVQALARGWCSCSSAR
jgi:hypothetical protein